MPSPPAAEALPDSLLPEEKVKTLLRRVMRRRARGDQPPRVHLPENKNAFPKLLCLDLNQWIYLGHARYGYAKGERYREALDSVEAARKRRSIVVPVTDTNALETAQCGNPGRRQRTAELMVDISGNQSMTHGVLVRAVELQNAVLGCYLGLGERIAIRPNLVNWGMAAAHTGRAYPQLEGIEPKDLRVLMAEVSAEPEISVASLSRPIDAAKIQDLRAGDEGMARAMEASREGEGAPRSRRRVELWNALTGGTTAAILASILAKRGLESRTFFQWLGQGDNLDRFTSFVPGLDMSTTVMFARDANPQKRADRNDGKDLSFLELGIVYANVVVTERLWSHLAVDSGVAETYGTTVLPKLTNLPKALADAGCI